jgi:hypothetical protein
MEETLPALTVAFSSSPLTSLIWSPKALQGRRRMGRELAYGGAFIRPMDTKLVIDGRQMKLA